MKRKVIILGSGSELYFRAKPNSLELVEYRTCQISEIYQKHSESDILVVFSLLKAKELKSLYANFSGRILIVGSASAFHPSYRRFSYSRLKNEQLKFVENMNDTRLKYLVFGEFFICDDRFGRRAISKTDDLWRLDAHLASDAVIIPLYTVRGDITVNYAMLSLIDLMFAPFSTFLIRKFTRYIYGYNNFWTDK